LDSTLAFGTYQAALRPIGRSYAPTLQSIRSKDV
jgi:hypothetical protein